MIPLTRRVFMALSAAGAAAPALADDKQPPPSPLVEAQLRALVARYANQLSKEDRDDLKRLLAQIPKTAEALNAYRLPENSDPVPIFRPHRADRR